MDDIDLIIDRCVALLSFRDCFVFSAFYRVTVDHVFSSFPFTRP